jgi:hypothetical protein
MLCSSKYTDVSEERPVSIFGIEGKLSEQQATCLFLVAFLAYLKSEDWAVRCSETSVNYSELYNIPEDSTFHSHRCDNIRSNNVRVMSICDRLCGLVVRVPGFITEMYCVFCEVRTEFIYVM